MDNIGQPALSADCQVSDDHELVDFTQYFLRLAAPWTESLR